MRVTYSISIVTVRTADQRPSPLHITLKYKLISPNGSNCPSQLLLHFKINVCYYSLSNTKCFVRWCFQLEIKPDLTELQMFSLRLLCMQYAMKTTKWGFVYYPVMESYSFSLSFFLFYISIFPVSTHKYLQFLIVALSEPQP